jgi:hypothetical protein
MMRSNADGLGLEASLRPDGVFGGGLADARADG